MQIGFTVARCRLGSLLVAATERGVCAVKLGDDPAALKAELEQEFSGAEIGRDVEALPEWVDAILQFIEGDYPHLDLPLDIRATAFQARVWEQLRHIPYGETRTYSQVAEAIGEPKAVRAVARAVATNPVALVIPCHRVVHKGGKLSGYRWGVDRKRAILDMEHEDADEE